MTRRNRSLRVVLAAALLSLALGASQAAVVPRANDGSGTRARHHVTRTYHQWVPAVLKFVNLGVWLTPLPTPPPSVEPPTYDDQSAAALRSPKDPDEATTAKLVDNLDPF